MSHDYNYRIDATALDTYADHVLMIEGLAGKRADFVSLAYRHGAYVADKHWNNPRMARLETVLPGAGTPAQIYDDLQKLTGLLCTGVPTLTRNDPQNGDVRSRVIVSDPVEQPTGNERFKWAWPLWLVDGYWEDAAVSNSEVDTAMTTTGTIGPFTPGGNMDLVPKFTITCTAAGSNPAIEHQANGDKVTLATGFSTSDVIVIDPANPDPTARVLLNGTRAKNILTINRGWWFRLEHGVAATLDFTSTSGTWSVTTDTRDRWR